MNINIGDKFLVPTRGNDPFHWNFEYDESVVEVTVLEPSEGIYFHEEIEGAFWINRNYGYIVYVQASDEYAQWVPVGELRPVVNNKPKFKVGDVVRVLKNKFVSDLCPVATVGGLVYVTDVLNHGCQLSLVKDSHPDEHSERSLFFMNGEFEPYKE